MNAIVVWLVKDSLRLQDNPVLNCAINLAKTSGTDLIPVATVEPSKWTATQFGIARSGPHWQRARANSWFKLEEELKCLGSGLWFFEGSDDECLRQIRLQHDVHTVVTDMAQSTEETHQIKMLKQQGLRVIEVSGSELFQPDALRFSSSRIPRSFTQFRRFVEKKSETSPREPTSKPKKLPGFVVCPWSKPSRVSHAAEYCVSNHAELDYQGGESWAQSQWSDYLNQGALSHYKITRNAFSGRYNSSHLSVALAHGLISPRQIWHDTLEYERVAVKNESTYWLRFELLWREYLRWYAKRVGSKLFHQSGPEGRVYQCTKGWDRYLRWQNGETGFPIVDACQKELFVSGWMSNRGRQLVASCLINELQLDWRWGAAWFESQLADYDVAVNWGNWAYIAGVGPDPRGGRHFNLAQQAKRYDPEQVHQKYWGNICLETHGPKHGSLAA